MWSVGEKRRSLVGRWMEQSAREGRKTAGWLAKAPITLTWEATDFSATWLTHGCTTQRLHNLGTLSLPPQGCSAQQGHPGDHQLLLPTLSGWLLSLQLSRPSG